MAPNRTFGHKAFADWLIKHILYVSKDRTAAVQYSGELAGFSAEARRQYKRVVFLQPHRLKETLTSLARISVDYDDLRQVLPDDHSGLRTLVLFLRNQPHWPENRAKFMAHMERVVAGFDAATGDPAQIHAFYDAQAVLHKKDKQIDEAIEALIAYLTLDPNHAQTHGRIAALAWKGKDATTARIHYKRALDLEPDNRSYLQGYIAVLTANEQDDAEEALAALRSRHPKEAAIHEALGRRAQQRQEFAAAESAYRRIVSATKDKAKGYFLLGKLYEELKDNERARANLKKAALLNRGYRKHFNRTMPLELLLEEYFEVTRDYTRLKGLIPFSPATLPTLVRFLYQNNAWLSNRSTFRADLKAIQKKCREAAGDSAAIQRLRPWLTAYYTTLADIYLLEGKHQQAIATLEELVATDPDNAEGHYLLAQNSADRGIGTAVHHYERAVTLAPGSTSYKQGFATALAQAGRFDEAETMARAVLEGHPRDPALHETLGDIYEMAGKRDRAVEELSRAVTLSRGAERYRKKLARLMTGH